MAENSTHPPIDCRTLLRVLYVYSIYAAAPNYRPGQINGCRCAQKGRINGHQLRDARTLWTLGLHESLSVMAVAGSSICTRVKHLTLHITTSPRQYISCRSIMIITTPRWDEKCHCFALPRVWTFLVFHETQVPCKTSDTARHTPSSHALDVPTAEPRGSTTTCCTYAEVFQSRAYATSLSQHCGLLPSMRASLSDRQIASKASWNGSDLSVYSRRLH